MSARPKKEVRSCGIQASYIDIAPGILVFSICIDSAKQDTVGQKIIIVTNVDIISSGCGLTCKAVFFSKSFYKIIEDLEHPVCVCAAGLLVISSITAHVVL